MTQSPAKESEPLAGHKRRPGRPPNAAQPALKKTRFSTTTPASLETTSPAKSPIPGRKANQLPVKLLDNRPLPTLAEPQAVTLSKDEYRTIATSAVLQSSLDRSRLKWVCDGVFEKYWVKPETGKNAKALPPNNPEVKWQKLKGPCRIRIEPHIFEAEIYTEEKPVSKPAVVKQYVPPAQQSAYGQPYRQNQQAYGQQQNPYYQGRTLPPIQQPHVHSPATSNTLPPIKNISQSPAPPLRAQQTPPQQPEKKASPDPVISMLATRASSDPELKALMKEVATGNATQDQLKVFQSHIDELTKVIAEKKKKEDEEQATTDAAAKVKQQQQSEVIQYDGPAESVPVQRPFAQPQLSPAPSYQPQQQAWTPPAATTAPVVIAFTTVGAIEDRFLFPQHSILELLSPQHMLASFIVTRKGREAADPTSLEANTEYWQPVTLMVEVAYKREHILDCVQRWVKPVDEVRKHMQDVIERCTKAPDAYLALRLPVKGTAIAETEDVLREDAAALAVQEVKKRPNVKYLKKAKPVQGLKAGGLKKADGDRAAAGTLTAITGEAQGAPVESKDVNGAAVEPTDGNADGQATTESGRPKRAVRKSVRISEG